jgi:hypothetical protein
MKSALTRINAAVCESFLAAADALSRRRARDIPENTIDRLVDLRWLEWSGGMLRLTQVGEIVLMKVQAMAFAKAPAI